MAPYLVKKLGTALACAAAVKAASDSYTLTEEYTADNFFDKFDFYVSDSATGNYDPTHGFVNYRDQADAESLGLVTTSNGQIYIGPDHNNTYSTTGKGRDSVRVMSKSQYNQGLLVAKFSHLPVQSCGSWPAFWSYGSPWLSTGEIDYYEGWNELGHNVMALHTNETIAGSCLLTTTGIAAEVTTQDCNDEKVDASIGQYVGTGCGISDTTAGVWGSTTGATFAMEWADDAIKIWNWLPSNVPSDITAGTPDPDSNSDSWGEPQLLVEQSNCDLAKAFANQQLVFNIDFCGDTAGNSVLWADTCSSKGSTCVGYVAENPDAFTETYFMIDGIQFYEKGANTAESSASASLASPTATSESSGVLAGSGSVLEPSSGATSTYSHSTSYVYATSISTDDAGAETTVVIVVDTTICPVTATQASESSALATGTSETAASIAVTASAGPASTTSFSTSVEMTTSTVFTTQSSTITSCASTASACSVGDVTTVIAALSTTICPVTAAEASESPETPAIVASGSADTFGSAFSVAVSETAAAVQASITAAESESASRDVTGTDAAEPTSGATSKTVAVFTSISYAAQTTISTSRTTTSEAATETASRTSSGASFTSSISYASSTETVEAGTAINALTGTLQVASATGSYSWPGKNGTLSMTTGAAAAAASTTKSNTCSSLDCVVVTSFGSRTTESVGSSGFALVVLAGAMIML